MRKILHVAGVIVVMLVVLTALVLALGRSSVTVVSGQTGGGYDLTWSSIDGGGYMFSTGQGYSLGGTIGQTDAGVLNGENYTMAGGFWGGISSTSHFFAYREKVS
jgi:hypothetical protein